MLDIAFLYDVLNKDNVFIFVVGFFCGFCASLFYKRKVSFIDDFCPFAPCGYKKIFVNDKLKRIECNKNHKGLCMINSTPCLIEKCKGA